ncbi:hypothetical protein Ciccas_006685 [Cichlidogyrus casuarinus]|uniref:Uncharacterized protein n=1 Tax=Cichlidogyrus casuarinus TaxID=1844966 RepID=A0ABD2Q7H8_9PLAT
MKVGHSGKSGLELEKMILRLKKVLERTLAENERLKMAPGVMGEERLLVLNKENQKLKQELEAAKDVTGSRLLEARERNQAAFDKLSSQYESLRLSLLKEKQEKEQLQQKLEQFSFR